MGRGLWVTKSGATQGSLPHGPSQCHCSPPSKRHRPWNTSPPTHSLPGNHSESPRPAPGPSHSLEASGEEEEQLGRQWPCGAQAGGSWRLLGAILGCLQLSDPVGEPPVSRIPGCWVGMGRRKLPDSSSSSFYSDSPVSTLLPSRPHLMSSPVCTSFLGPSPFNSGESVILNLQNGSQPWGQIRRRLRSIPAPPRLPVPGTLRTGDTSLVPAVAHTWLSVWAL